MSARPRPVTATIKPASMDPPTGVRTRNYSLSSGGSTSSLISVLDHDSYESLGEDSEEERQRVKKEEERKMKALRRKEYGKATGLIGVKAPSRKRKGETFVKRNTAKSRNSETSETQTATEPTEDTSNKPQGMNMSSWEEWMIRKAKEERKHLKREIRKKQIEHKKEVEKKAEEEEKKKRVEVKVHEWMEKVSLRDQTRRRMEQQNKRTKEELEKEKKREIEAKAAQKDEEWMNQKKTILKEKKKEEKDKKKKEEEEKREKQKKCEEAYDEWLKKAGSRPKSVPNSFGYTSGRLTGYHDTGAYPTPSFYNPSPWQPIAIPKEKPANRKSRPKSTYKWNPNKYL